MLTPFFMHGFKTRRFHAIPMRLVGLLVLSVIFSLTLGCGGSSAPNSVVANDGTTTAPQAESAPISSVKPAVAPKSAPPTAEQLARWQRAPFEPLQLLSLREWPRLGFVSCMDKTPDGKQFVLGGTRVTLWNINSTEPEHVFLDLTEDETPQKSSEKSTKRSNTPRERFLISLAISPDGKWVAVGDSMGRLKAWNLADKKEIATKELQSTGVVEIAISPDSQTIATISYDSQISLWRAATLEPIKKFKPTERFVKHLHFVTNDTLAIAGEKSSIWDINTTKQIQELSPGRYHSQFAHTPDNKTFVYGVEEGLRFWNIAESKPAGKMPGKFDANHLMEFSPDGKYLAVASKFVIEIWDLASQQMVQVIDVLGREVRGLSWMPESNALVIANEFGGFRIWGAAASAQSLGLKPLHGEIKLPDPATKEPATREQIFTAIDFRTFPQLQGSVVRIASSSMLDCQVPVSVAEATNYYRYQLSQAGWQELAPSPTTSPGSIDYRKQGFMLFTLINEEEPGKTHVSLTHLGNYNARWAPKTDVAPVKVSFESDTTSLYMSKGNLTQLETNLLRKMHAAGWTAYTRLNSSHHDDYKRRDLEFLRNGTIFHISIQPSLDEPETYHIQYGSHDTRYTLPIPRDSGFVEFDGAVEPHLVALTDMTFEQTQAFYDEAMQAEGWLIQPRGHTLKEEYCWLTYLRGQQDLVIGLEKRPTGQTLVRVGKGLENSSWQLAKTKDEEDEEKTKSDKAAKTASKKPKPGIEAADFPLLNASKKAEYDTEQKSMELQFDSLPLKEISALYTEELGKIGFVPQKSGIRDDEYTYFSFEKDNAQIQYRSRFQNGKSTANFQGNGILWTKELPGPKHALSYESWLRKNRHPASLKLLDKFEAEMKELVSGGTKAEKE